jgi:hypothetical protein
MSNKKNNGDEHNALGWDFAISQLEEKLRRKRSEVAEIMSSLSSARELKASGRPWPGSLETTGTAVDSVPAKG